MSVDFNWKDAAATELREKLDTEARLIDTLDEQMQMMIASKDAAALRIASILDGAAALGIELAPPARAIPEAKKPASAEASGATARDIVLAELSENPGMKSAELKAAIERRMGREIHYKTPGMTLYRLAQEGLVERQGIRWFLKSDQEAPTAEPELI